MATTKIKFEDHNNKLHDVSIEQAIHFAANEAIPCYTDKASYIAQEALELANQNTKVLAAIIEHITKIETSDDIIFGVMNKLNLGVENSEYVITKAGN